MDQAKSRPTRTTVFRYAVIKGDLPPQVLDELRRAHNCKNALVEIEKRYEDKIAAVFASHPEIAAAMAVVADAEEELGEVLREAGAERQRRHSSENTPQTTQAIRDARTRLRAAKDEMKKIRRQYTPGLKPQLRAVEAARKEELKAAYPASGQAGLYWASYNEARANFDTAVQAVQRDRRAGKPAGLRFRPWDGRGTIAVQLQRASGGRVKLTWSVKVRPLDDGGKPELPEVPVELVTDGDVKATLSSKEIEDGVRLYTAEITNRGPETAQVRWTADLEALLKYADYGADAEVAYSDALEDHVGAGNLLDGLKDAEGAGAPASLVWEAALPGGDEYRGPVVLRSEEGKWRNAARILPSFVLADDTDRRTLHQGKKAELDGVIEMRIGSTAYRDDIGESVTASVRTWLTGGGTDLIWHLAKDVKLAGRAEKVLECLADHADTIRDGGKTYGGMSRAQAVKASKLSSEDAEEAIRVLVRAGKIRDLSRKLLLVGVTYQDHVRLPVVLHRPLPEGADVSMLLLTRHKTGPHYKAHISVVADVPAPDPHTEGALTALHIGWRRLGDGAIRAGVVVGLPRDTEVSPEIRDWVRVHEDWAEIVLPANWRESWAHYDKLQSQRDLNMEDLRGWLTERFEQYPWLREHLDPSNSLSRWRSPERFIDMAGSMWIRPEDGGQWKIAPVPEVEGANRTVWGNVAMHVEAWRKQDKHLWTWLASGRQKLIGRRQSAYRVIAAWLTRDAAVVAVDAWDIKATSRTPRPESGENTKQAQIARANRTLASPGILRDSLRDAANARGIRVEVPELPGPTKHLGCGGVFDPDERAAGVMVCCPTCDKMVDQDVMSARALLEAAKAGQ
ncbi:hypothetical protein [Actinomadura sp. K4S16]|uniref:hypothetical protein n=1 Tax=Actinomadura sp. K4S16 TaxID=1316147 RepID=UPI0011ED1B9C|nr:hypothetical protein [Actinomadura sp. K4S16]